MNPPLTLTAERARGLLDYNPETGVLTWHKDGRQAGTATNRNYRKIQIGVELHGEFARAR